MSYFLADQIRHSLYDSNVPGLEVRAYLQGHRAVPLSYGHHVRGWHPVHPFHEPVAFESKLEAAVISAVCNLGELRRIQSQPVTLGYRCRGTRYRYTPDFRVSFRHVPRHLYRLGFDHDSFVEVKPLHRAWREQASLHRRFSAIRLAFGRPIVLITEVDLPHLLGELAHGH